jgi:hypothetical protein
MIDRSQVPVPVRVDGRDDQAEAGERDEVSMRLVEWILALVALGAAVVLAIR